MPIAATSNVSRDEALRELARLLYEEMERLAPSGPEHIDWGSLPEWERDLHVHGVRRVLRERPLLALVLRGGDGDT